MVRWRVLVVLVLLICLEPVTCFFPNRFSAVSDKDFTMEDITQQAVYGLLLDTERDFAKELSDIIQKNHLNVEDVLRDLGEGVSEIVDNCNLVDIQHPSEPVWSFSDEQIMQGHQLLIALRERLIQTVGRSEQANIHAARETLGQIFHLLLMFYSNTNWVELGYTDIYMSLGTLNKPLLPVAPKEVPTCEACGTEFGRNCTKNVIVTDFLTSGYIGQPDELSEPVQVRLGKCRHGGLYDKVSGGETVPGGINKRSTDPGISPHHFLHETAAHLAIKHVQFYLDDQEYGLRRTLGERAFLRLFIDNLEIKREHDAGSRERRSSSGVDFYQLIADASGGTVYKTDKSNIAAVVDIIKESVSTKPPVTVMKFRQLSSSSDSFSIPVDDLIDNVTIKVQNSNGSVPGMALYRPDGSEETFSNPTAAEKHALGHQLIVFRLYRPTRGVWRMERKSREELDVDVTAITSLELSYKFLQPGPGGYGEYPLVGRPIAGENTTVQVSVPLVDKLSSVDTLLLLDQNGALVDNVTLTNIGGRRGKSLFKSHVVIPIKEFEVAVEGKDLKGNLFRRLNPKLVSSLHIQLKVLPVSGTLYINKTITIPYQVRNVGGGSVTIDVSISDDKGFAQSPTSDTHIVAANSNANGSFVLKAGSVKGETTTVTISAKMSGAASNKVQYSVQRITVEEKIIRVIDKTAPMCNVTSTMGLCDFGSDICQCSRQSWEMAAVLGDDGDGLQSVFPSNAGNSSTFTVDTFTAGHKIKDGFVHARIKADCCHQHAKITVVDLAGNVGLCEVSITPGFVPPDPKLCSLSTKQTVSTNVNVTKISCTVINITGSCDGSTANSSHWCEHKFWDVEAQLGNEGFGKIQVAAVNAGKNANLTRSNHSLALSTDCCHADVYINAVDIAGHIGQCHATLTVTNPPSAPASTASSSSVGAIAGGTVGGVAVIGVTAALAVYVKKRLAKNTVEALTTSIS